MLNNDDRDQVFTDIFSDENCKLSDILEAAKAVLRSLILDKLYNKY